MYKGWHVGTSIALLQLSICFYMKFVSHPVPHLLLASV